MIHWTLAHGIDTKITNPQKVFNIKISGRTISCATTPKPIAA